YHSRTWRRSCCRPKHACRARYSLKLPNRKAPNERHKVFALTLQRFNSEAIVVPGSAWYFTVGGTDMLGSNHPAAAGGGVDRESSGGQVCAPQAKRNCEREARAVPPLMSGVMISSSVLTPESWTEKFSASCTVVGGLKFHCWRTISWGCPVLGIHRNTNSCVRAASFSSNASSMRWIFCG